jgi:hypothetical protein
MIASLRVLWAASIRARYASLLLSMSNVEARKTACASAAIRGSSVDKRIIPSDLSADLR